MDYNKEAESMKGAGLDSRSSPPLWSLLCAALFFLLRGSSHSVTFTVMVWPTLISLRLNSALAMASTSLEALMEEMN